MIEEKNRIRAFARENGFDVTGVASPVIPEQSQAAYNDYVEQNLYGDMLWLGGNSDRRNNPRNLWPQVQSVIVLGQSYAPDTNPLAKLNYKNTGNISCYAGNLDYHDVMKKKLKVIAGWMAKEFACEVKVFVDTAPILEKPLAEQAGIGWQGKHGCVISRQYGSWLFLGEIFTTLPLPPDTPHKHHCGSCSRCMDICPTQAFIAPHKLDPRKCISYLTIEHKGPIPLQYRKAMGNRIYGCDDCLAVCPWNRFAETSQEIAYHPRAALTAPLLAELVQLDDAGFRMLFSKSPVKRIGRDRFIRNVLIAIGNSEEYTLIPVIKPLLDDVSELVREAAGWAIRELVV